MSESKNIVEVCFSPVVYGRFHKDDAIVVVVDIFFWQFAYTAVNKEEGQKIY